MIDLKIEIILRCFLLIFLIEKLLTVSAVETTTVRPLLTTTMEATTTMKTPTTPTEATKFIGPHDHNSSTTTLKEMDTTIPTTTEPYTAGYSTINPMPAIKVTPTVTHETLNITTTPVDQRTICYPAEDLLSVTTNTTQNVIALTQAARTFLDLSDTPGTSFVDLSVTLPLQASEIHVADPDQNPQVTWETNLSPGSTDEPTKTEAQPETTTLDSAGTSSGDWTFALSLQTSNIHDYLQYPQITAAIPLTVNTVAPKKEPVKKKAANYNKAELLGYAELATKPFSKYLELVLERLKQLSDILCARFFLMFAHKMIRLASVGNLNHFGPTTPQFIVYSANEVVKKPKEFIKQLMHSYHIRILHRREVLSADANLLLDYMDMLYTYEDELAMDRLLKEFMAFPNVNRTVYDIVEDTVSQVILKPSWRLIHSGKPRGRMLFEYMNKMISGHTDPNSNIDKKITELTKRNNEFVKKNIKGRIKIVCEVTSPTKQTEKKQVTKAIKRRNIYFERAWARPKEITKYKYSSTAYKTGSVFKHFNGIPTEAYWNVNRNIEIKRENKLSSIRSQNQYPKSNIHELYQKYKHNKKENIDTNIRRRGTFIGLDIEMDKHFERRKVSVSNDAKQNVMLRAKSTVEADKEMSIFDSQGAFTQGKGLEIPVLGEIKYTEITRRHNKYDEHAYRKVKYHTKRKSDSHKMHKLGRRESIITHLRKRTDDNKKKHERKLRNNKRQQNYSKRYNNIDKYNRKNDVDFWEYYLKRAKETDQSDTENSFDNSLTKYKGNEITSNGDNFNKDMEILWYDKDKFIVDQSAISQSYKHSKEIGSYKKLNDISKINESEDVIESERLQNIKLSNRMQSNDHKFKDYVTKSQKKKPQYAYHTKKRLQQVKPQKLIGVDDILRYTLQADIDRIKQQVGKDIEYNEDKYYKRKKLIEKIPHIAKTPTSPKDRSVESGSHANKLGDKARNLYIKDLKLHKNLIDVRRNVEHLRRHPKYAKDALKFSTVNTLVDSAYSDEEKELKNNLYDALRHEDRTFFRRNLNHDSTLKSGLRDDSEYTDTEVVLKQKIYKSIQNMIHKRQNRTALKQKLS